MPASGFLRALGKKGTQNNVFAYYIVADSCNPSSVTGEMWHLLVLWRWDVTAWTEQSVGMSWELPREVPGAEGKDEAAPEAEGR